MLSYSDPAAAVEPEDPDPVDPVDVTGTVPEELDEDELEVPEVLLEPELSEDPELEDEPVVVLPEESLVPVLLELASPEAESPEVLVAPVTLAVFEVADADTPLSETSM